MIEQIRKYLDEEGFLARTQEEVIEFVRKEKGQEGLDKLKEIFEYTIYGRSKEQNFYDLVSHEVSGTSFYDLLKSRDRGLLEWYYERFSIGMSPADRVLDVGCGNGLESCFLGELANQGKVVGIDLNQKMVKRARNRARKRNLDNVIIERMDRDYLSLDEESFDRVIAQNSLITPGEDCEYEDSLYNLALGRKISNLMGLLKPHGTLHIFMSIFPEFEELETSRLRYCLEYSGAEIKNQDFRKNEDNFVHFYISGEKK